MSEADNVAPPVRELLEQDPEPLTSELEVLAADLDVDLASAAEEEDAFQRATEDEVDRYVERLREIAAESEDSLRREGL